MTRKPRGHVRILIYWTWAIMKPVITIEGRGNKWLRNGFKHPILIGIIPITESYSWCLLADSVLLVRVVKVAHPDSSHIYYNRLPRFPSLPRRRSCPTTVGEDCRRSQKNVCREGWRLPRWYKKSRVLYSSCSCSSQKKKSFKVPHEIHNCDLPARETNIQVVTSEEAWASS